MSRQSTNVSILVLLSMMLLQPANVLSSASGASGASAKKPAKAGVSPNGKLAKAKAKAKSKKKSIDYNALGLAAFNKKNYVESLRLFGMAQKNDPKNPLSWLNHARATIAVFGANDPENYCDADKNWVFDALSSLSKATDLGAAKVLPVLASIKDLNFQKFRVRPEFKNWDLIHRLPLKTDLATQEFFAKHNDWLIDNDPNPATVVTFAPTHELTIAAADGARETGTWSAGADRVVIKTKTAIRTMNLTTTNYVFGRAKKSFRTVILRDSATAQVWEIGPEIADCPNP